MASGFKNCEQEGVWNWITSTQIWERAPGNTAQSKIASNNARQLCCSWYLSTCRKLPRLNGCYLCKTRETKRIKQENENMEPMCAAKKEKGGDTRLENTCFFTGPHMPTRVLPQDVYSIENSWSKSTAQRTKFSEVWIKRIWKDKKYGAYATYLVVDWRGLGVDRIRKHLVVEKKGVDWKIYRSWRCYMLHKGGCQDLWAPLYWMKEETSAAPSEKCGNPEIMGERGEDEEIKNQRRLRCDLFFLVLSSEYSILFVNYCHWLSLERIKLVLLSDVKEIQLGDLLFSLIIH